jgi:hypothetical protein
MSDTIEQVTLWLVCFLGGCQLGRWWAVIFLARSLRRTTSVPQGTGPTIQVQHNRGVGQVVSECDNV